MAEAPEKSNCIRDALLMIKQFHSDGIYWDVQLQVGTKVFKGQRSLLAAHSEYFHTMFSSSNFEESNATVDQPITLYNIDATVFEELLSFMYTGDISVNDSNVFKLFFMNDFLQLRTGHIKKQCLEHVKSRSQEDEPMSNALDLQYFAHLKGEKVFVDILNAHISRHLLHYSNDVQLMEISFENLNSLLQFSKDYILPLRGSADVLLKIVHAWINHNREGRSQYRRDLMENIDVANNISSVFAVSLVNTLENAADEIVMSLSKDIESLSKLKTLVMGIATNLPVSDDQFDAIISFNFKNVSEMQIDGLAVHSSSCIISDLSWKIGIKRQGDELGMFLYCFGTDLTPEWNCYASAIFTIRSHKKGRDDFVRELQPYLFASNGRSYNWGPISRIKWNDLMDSANGYLCDDGSITLKVHVYADVPFLKMI